MKYERNWNRMQLQEATALSLGKFDGIHQGHEKLLKSILEKKQQGMASAIFTFDIPPKIISGRQSKVITTNQEKKHLFETAGIDYLMECPFTEEFMHMEAEIFIREIVKRLHVHFIAVGRDFHFGYQRKGDARLLSEYAGTYGYELQVVDKVRYQDREISSTFIRDEIGAGHMELANKLLGHPYFILGEVVQGNKIGRTIGFPTINQLPAEEKLLPPFGAYLSEVHIEDRSVHGITNIGRKPTIHGVSPVGAETFLLDFNENIYGKMIKTDILKFLRPEQKFQDIGALKEQLAQDVVLAEKMHHEHISQKSIIE